MRQVGPDLICFTQNMTFAPGNKLHIFRSVPLYTNANSQIKLLSLLLFRRGAVET